MKFGQLTDYNKGSIFFESYAENEAKRLVSDPFFFSQKA